MTQSSTTTRFLSIVAALMFIGMPRARAVEPYSYQCVSCGKEDSGGGGGWSTSETLLVAGGVGLGVALIIAIAVSANKPDSQTAAQAEEDRGRVKSAVDTCESACDKASILCDQLCVTRTTEDGSEPSEACTLDCKKDAFSCWSSCAKSGIPNAATP